MPGAEMQGEKMEICKLSLDKRNLSRIIRQHKSVRFSCPEFHIAIQKDVLRPQVFCGRGASFFCLEIPAITGKGVSVVVQPSDFIWRL